MARVVKVNPEIERFEARISADTKKILKDAAELSGRTLTDFVINSAYEAAKHIIQEHQQLHLTAKDSEIFVKAILNPPKPSAYLLKAAKRYKKMLIPK